VAILGVSAAWLAGGSKEEMGIVHLPVWRLAGNAERIAFREGLSLAGSGQPVLRVLSPAASAAAFCASCAAPIEFGAVWRRGEAYCSVECSLGGGRPA
jgi:hypothetical protein